MTICVNEQYRFFFFALFQRNLLTDGWNATLVIFAKGEYSYIYTHWNVSSRYSALTEYRAHDFLDRLLSSGRHRVQYFTGWIRCGGKILWIFSALRFEDREIDPLSRPNTILFRRIESRKCVDSRRFSLATEPGKAPRRRRRWRRNTL